MTDRIRSCPKNCIREKCFGNMFARETPANAHLHQLVRVAVATAFA